MPYHWTCPYCDRDTTITGTYSDSSFALTLENADGPRYFKTLIIVCPNPKCQRFTLTLEMYSATFYTSGTVNKTKFLTKWDLIPGSTAKAFPSYVPKPILDDYAEACKIKNLSAKASATLSRRCLQGMIRDFWKISKKRLIDEIEALETKIDSETWKAIDAVRSIGNIGAHMETDINVIVDVDQGEAQTLIGLIELLIKDWYVARHQRAEQVKAIVQIKDAKLAQKKPSTP